MLPFLSEYRITHERFPTHARVAYLMAMVAPASAITLGYLRNLDNLWLWAACSAGAALALCLHSMISMHRRPAGLSSQGRRLVECSDIWFPYFFVVIQSMIASLIVIFVWFALTKLALPMPASVHVALVVFAMVIPLRRYTEARMMQGIVTVYDRRFELLRGIWHILVTYIVTHVFMGITAYDVMDRPHENIHWHTTLWVPALLYMIFAMIMMLARLKNISAAMAGVRAGAQPQQENIERF